MRTYLAKYGELKSEGNRIESFTPVRAGSVHEAAILLAKRERRLVPGTHRVSVIPPEFKSFPCPVHVVKLEVD